MYLVNVVRSIIIKKIQTHQFVPKKNQLMVCIGHPFECAKSAYSSLIIGKTNYMAPLLYQPIKIITLLRFYIINSQTTHTNIVKCTECSQWKVLQQILILHYFPFDFTQTKRNESQQAIFQNTFLSETNICTVFVTPISISRDEII